MNAPRIVKQSSGPAVATDGENRIISLNQAARKLLGYNNRQARGRSLHELMQARDANGNRLSAKQYAFFDMVSRSEPVRSFDLEVQTASGDPLRVAVSVIVVLEAAGGDYELVYQLRPIYRRRKADEAIERILASRGTAAEDPTNLRGNDSPPEAPELTTRQIEILRFMARGAQAQEMASTLGISVHTVRTHIQRLLRRLGVHSQLEAVAAAFRLRLI